MLRQRDKKDKREMGMKGDEANCDATDEVGNES